MVRSSTKRQTGGGHTAAAPLVPRHATPPSLRPPLIQRGALAPGFAFTFTFADGCTGEPACRRGRLRVQVDGHPNDSAASKIAQNFGSSSSSPRVCELMITLLSPSVRTARSISLAALA